MISVIVVSKNSLLFDQFSNCLKESAGLNYEIIKVDNSSKNLPIVRAYNNAGKVANFPFLIFVHEDVIFHTQNWGKILLHNFNNLHNPGLLGIAGSSYLPISPSDWWISDTKYMHTFFMSNKRDGIVGEGPLEEWGNQIPQKVFALDGMFLAMKKSVWEEFPFEESLDGFHGYDTSICYRVSQKYQNYFVPGILLEHFSKGYPNETWLINTVKANRSIIQYIDHLKKNTFFDRNLEVKAYHLFLNQLKKFSSSHFFCIKNSTFYLFRCFNYFFDYRLLLLWFRFQLVYVLKILFK